MGTQSKVLLHTGAYVSGTRQHNTPNRPPRAQYLNPQYNAFVALVVHNPPVPVCVRTWYVRHVYCYPSRREPVGLYITAVLYEPCCFGFLFLFDLTFTQTQYPQHYDSSTSTIYAVCTPHVSRRNYSVRVCCCLTYKYAAVRTTLLESEYGRQ